jgi:hypothetical protein
VAVRPFAHDVFVGDPEGHGGDALGASKQLSEGILAGAVDLTTTANIPIALASAAAGEKLVFLVLAHLLAKLDLDFAEIAVAAVTTKKPLHKAGRHLVNTFITKEDAVSASAVERLKHAVFPFTLEAAHTQKFWINFVVDLLGDDGELAAVLLGRCLLVLVGGGLVLVGGTLLILVGGELVVLDGSGFGNELKSKFQLIKQELKKQQQQQQHDLP